jgi:hypothetical protein
VFAILYTQRLHPDFILLLHIRRETYRFISDAEQILQVYFFSLAPKANSGLGCVTDHTHLDARAR